MKPYKNDILNNEDLDFFKLKNLNILCFGYQIHARDNKRFLLQQIREGQDPLYKVIESYEFNKK